MSIHEIRFHGTRSVKDKLPRWKKILRKWRDRIGDWIETWYTGYDPFMVDPTQQNACYDFSDHEEG